MDSSSAPSSSAPSPASSHPIDALLAAHNGGLASAGVGLRIERRGERLGLRGPLPRRQGSGGSAVQRISLGLPASEAGLAEAARQLRQVLAELPRQQFAWRRWGRSAPAPAAEPPGPRPSPRPRPSSPLEQQLQVFEQAFKADPVRRPNPAGSRTTWTAAYRPYLRRLAQAAREGGERQLRTPLLVQVLESYPPGSRSRQQCCTVLGALAQHLELELPGDWRQRAAGYGLHRAQFRQLPSDSQILQWQDLIPNPAWRLAYGLMATYGLRNHEVFFCDLSALAPGGDRVIRVLPTSKTGEHQVWPFRPEWVERFELERLGRDPGLLPAVRTDLSRTTLQQAGRRMAEQFKRYAMPITPYDLRHAWAVRTIHVGLPDTVAARMMGHSVAIHTRTYHHWITRRDQQQAVDAALARQSAA
jgi:integrase